MESIRKIALIKQQKMLERKLQQKMEEAEQYIERQKMYKNFNISTDSKAIKHRVEIQELEKQLMDITDEISRISNAPKRTRKAVMPNTQQLSAEQHLLRNQQEFRKAQMADQRVAAERLEVEHVEPERRRVKYQNYDFRTVLNRADEENKWYTIVLKEPGIRDANGKKYLTVYGTPIGDINPVEHQDATSPSRLFDIKCRPTDGSFHVQDIPGITSFYATIENTDNIIRTIAPYHAPGEEPVRDPHALWFSTAIPKWQGPAERKFYGNEPPQKTMRHGEYEFSKGKEQEKEREREGVEVPFSQAATAPPPESEVPFSQAATAPPETGAESESQAVPRMDVHFTQELLDSYDTKKIYAISLRQPLIGMDGNDDSVVYGFPTSGTFEQYYDELLFPSREFRIYSMTANKLVKLSVTLVVNDMTTTEVIETDLPKPSQGGKSRKKIKKSRKTKRK
jgi:hypothetical protein